MRVEKLASGPGWSVSDIVCSSGPHDRPFEEQHPSVCIAAVMQGSFHYRTTQGAATLVPGAVLLGNHQSCFECGHDHGTGDRCLSFMFEPGCFEAILASVPGARKAGFPVARLPPLMSLTRIFADAETAWLDNDRMCFEQQALDLAGETARLAADGAPLQPSPSYRDQQRIAATLRRIETTPGAPASINEMARDVAMSPYHFLRIFRCVVGMAPHQFVLRTRLQRAAVQLRRSSQPVLDIALDAGFGDLSTFNRRFRRLIGMTPSAYRRSGRSIRNSQTVPGSFRILSAGHIKS
jgi:AraC family transcriptional regulator